MSETAPLNAQQAHAINLCLGNGLGSGLPTFAEKQTLLIMPDVQIPVIPLSEATQFADLPDVLSEVLSVDPTYPVGMFMFAVVPPPKWPTDVPQVPQQLTRLMVVFTDSQMAASARTAIDMIEPFDLARLGKAPDKRSPPPEPRSKLSIRKVFAWMESAPATVYTIGMGSEKQFSLVAFVRTADTITNFRNELVRITKTFDSAN